MAVPASVLLVELVMSADRVITAAQKHRGEVPQGAWSPAVIVGHLSLVDTQVWLPRIDAMVAALGAAVLPEFAWWEPDSDVTDSAFGQGTVDDAGAQLLVTRTAVLHRLRELTDVEWTGTAHHEVFGLIDLQGLVLAVLAHDEEHRAALLLPRA